ncbi:hypothetical protein E4U39_001823 [Claviceps sp. Clav50 group G5]|nr:hypothetical protein E4U39_001823 [Claviceps sp. Clav50 group G5]
MASLTAANYVPSDPKTCFKDQGNRKRNLGQREGETQLSPRTAMGGSIKRQFLGRRGPCLDCCRSASMLCHATCQARYSGPGAAFWQLAACQSACQAWDTSCVAACYNLPE